MPDDFEFETAQETYQRLGREAWAFQRFRSLWAQYQSILAEPTFEMSKADQQANAQRLDAVYAQLTTLSKEGV